MVEEEEKKTEETKPEEKKVEEKAEEKAVKEAEAAKEVSAERPLEKGDFVLIDLTGRAEDTGEIIETSVEETAKNAGVYSEERTYGPRIVVVGEGWLMKGLDNGLIGLKVGAEAKIEVQPQDAFGDRDPNKVKMVPYRLLRSKGVNPSVGAQVEYEGRTAFVRSMGAGRVQLDYNPALAGRKLLYEVKILKRFETDEEKIKALIQRRIAGIDPEKFGLKVMKKKVSIDVPEEVLYGENLQLVKRGLSLDIMKFFPNVEEVSFTEVFKPERPSEQQKQN
jgi:FKBP-type peptidyl-prolyl cis-trans isomerase 2